MWRWIKKAKKKIAWFFLGGIAFAAGVSMTPENEPNFIQGEESTFAHVDKSGIVDNVIVISQNELNSGNWGDPSEWRRTSPKGTIRKNYAGKGYVFDKQRNAFIPPKMHQDDVLDETTARWVTPKSAFVTATST